MYKLLLSLRYLRTRWIALASIISVTLGVATLIVVNSVMGGFATEMRERVRGVLADIIIKGGGMNGFPAADFHMKRITQELGDRITAMTPVVETLGMMTFDVKGRSISEPVVIRGIDTESYPKVGKFAQYLHEQELRDHPTFALTDRVRSGAEPWRGWNSESLIDDGPATTFDPSDRPDAAPPGGVMLGAPQASEQIVPAVAETPARDDPAGTQIHGNPFEQQPFIDVAPAAPKHRGIIVPWLLASYRMKGEDIEVIQPGHDVLLTLPSASIGTLKVEGRHAQFTTVGRFRSGMSEYDHSHCYVDIRDLQEIRGMGDNVNAIEIKLTNYADAPEVIRRLERLFPPGYFTVHTWEQEQRSLLTAVQIEQCILNVLLFMIIAVAGFGILAIFFMIVVEKTRDIGILKSLGASNFGVMQIFLTYGFSLGAVGGGLGMAIGLAIVVYLDKVERFLSWLCGYDVFNRDLYYFDKIPTMISWFNITIIVGAAVLIALAASVLPASRAATMRPVQAIRYE
jgi:lipoprotein-releasing system permease protein